MDAIKTIADRCTSQNITQKELAESAGINQSDISKLGNGIGILLLICFKRLAEGMGMALKIEFVPKQNV